MQKVALLLAALAALVAPSLARAGDVAMHVEDVPLGARSPAAAPKPVRFNMLAAHWQGSGTVAYRVHRLQGRWTAWTAADADNRAAGWHAGNLDWTGAADRVQFRASPGIRRLRAFELWSRVERRPMRKLSEAQSPLIVPRTEWEADERIVRQKPLIAPVLKLAVVHHTAGTNRYTAAQAAAIVRGIETYHVKGNGWNDIGYNFLVDRFGNVYEGRGGGIDKNVIGAHAEGFNSGTVGVALIGNYQSATPPKAQQDALVKLLAWRLDVAHVDPLATVVYTSGGNAKFRAGKLVTLRAVSGHRDTGPSECPGRLAYGLLPALAKRVAATGLPKLYTPSVAGALGGPIRFQARLSSRLAWTVTVSDQVGRPLATGKGRGSVVDWTWQSPVRRGRYTWTIAAPGLRVATGSLGVAAPAGPLSLTNLALTPAVSGGGPVTTTFTLGGAAHVTAQLLDVTGASVVTLLDADKNAGANTLTFDASPLADGRYRVVVTATSGTKRVTKTAALVVDRTVSGLVSSLPAISPNADGVNDTVSLSFTLSADVPVRLEVQQAGAVLVTLFQGTLAVGAHTLTWDGTVGGAPMPDGKLTLVLTVTDGLGDVPFAVPLVLDTRAPALVLVDKTTLSFDVDEPATVTVLVNGRTRIVRTVTKPGPFTVPYTGGAVESFSAQAQDAAGNLSPLLTG